MYSHFRYYIHRQKVIANHYGIINRKTTFSLIHDRSFYFHPFEFILSQNLTSWFTCFGFIQESWQLSTYNSVTEFDSKMARVEDRVIYITCDKLTGTIIQA